MLESYLEPGNQPITRHRADLRYGVSITDACLGWPQTEALLRSAAAEVNGLTEVGDLQPLVSR